MLNSIIKPCPPKKGVQWTPVIFFGVFCFSPPHRKIIALTSSLFVPQGGGVTQNYWLEQEGGIMGGAIGCNWKWGRSHNLNEGV